MKKKIEGGKAHVDLKIETKGYDIREKIKDNTIRIISVQSKALKGHAENLKERFNYALKEATYAKLTHKDERYQVLDLLERMGKTILN